MTMVCVKGTIEKKSLLRYRYLMDGMSKLRIVQTHEALAGVSKQWDSLSIEVMYTYT